MKDNKEEINSPATLDGLDPTSKAPSTGLSTGRKAVKDTESVTQVASKKIRFLTYIIHCNNWTILPFVKTGLETLSNIENAVCKAGVHLTTE